MKLPVWDVLSQIDVNKHVKEKGGFSYLAWTWAWATVKQHYPEADYEVLEDRYFIDETMEVRCRVTIEGLSHTMWLPVTDHRNAAIERPDSFAVNTARMRCLVKNLAMFGLGHYIYAGESLPTPSPISGGMLEAFNLAIAADDMEAFAELYESMSEQHRADALSAQSQGTKTRIKEKVHKLINNFEALVTDYVTAFSDSVSANDQDQLHQIVDEVEDGNSYTKQAVWARLDGPTKAGIRAMLKENPKKENPDE